jgi:hypothetical protein
MLVSIYHMLDRGAVYDPPGVSALTRILQRRIAMPTSEAFVDDRLDLRADPLVSRQQMFFPSTDPTKRTLEVKAASLRFLFQE